MTPRISVVIPTWNRGALVGATIDSVLAQDAPPEEVEVLVVDDGSTDDTRALLHERYDSHPRVCLFDAPHLGVAGARNFGLEHARGEFIAFLDHDDLWLPSKLRLQVQEMTNPRVGVVYSLWKEVAHDGQELGFSRTLTPREWHNPPKGNVADRILVNNFLISMSVPLIRTRLLREVGGFDASTVPCDDWDVWVRLAAKCEFGVVSEVGVLYFRHIEQQSSNQERMNRASRRVMRKHWKRYASFILRRPAYALPLYWKKFREKITARSTTHTASLMETN